MTSNNFAPSHAAAEAAVSISNSPAKVSRITSRSGASSSTSSTDGRVFDGTGEAPAAGALSVPSAIGHTAATA